MKYKITMRVLPSGDFGLPEEEYTVIPGDIGAFHGPSLDTATGQLVGYPTLPVYRKESEQLNVELSLPRSKVNFVDNNIFCEVEAANHTEALQIAMEDIGKLLRLMSARRGIFYSAYPLSIVDIDLKAYRLPTSIKFGSFRIYSLLALKNDLSEAEKSAGVLDDRLQKAVLYMQNALLMMNTYQTKPKPLDTTDFNVVSLIALELWKSCTSIMGDTSVRKDRFQKRYLEIGITADIKAQVDKLNLLRNGYDVAHYSLEKEKKQLLENELPFAFTTAKSVILAYESYLRRIVAESSAESGST